MKHSKNGSSPRDPDEEYAAGIIHNLQLAMRSLAQRDHDPDAWGFASSYCRGAIELFDARLGYD